MSPEDRRELAAESVTKVPVIANNPTRTHVIASLHQRLLHKAKTSEEGNLSSATEDKTPEAAPEAAAPEAAAPNNSQPPGLPKNPQPSEPVPLAPTAVAPPPQSPEERVLTLLAGALVAIIVAILLRKCVAGLDVLTGHESSSPHI